MAISGAIHQGPPPTNRDEADDCRNRDEDAPGHPPEQAHGDEDEHVVVEAEDRLPGDGEGSHGAIIPSTALLDSRIGKLPVVRHRGQMSSSDARGRACGGWVERRRSAR